MRVAEGTSAITGKGASYLNAVESSLGMAGIGQPIWFVVCNNVGNPTIEDATRVSQLPWDKRVFRPVYRGSSVALSDLKIDWLRNQPGQHQVMAPWTGMTVRGPANLVACDSGGDAEHHDSDNCCISPVHLQSLT